MRSGNITGSKCNRPGVIFGWLLLVVATGFFAENAVAADAAAVDQHAMTVPEHSVFDSIDPSKKYVSEKIVDYSLRIDHFFGDKRYFQDHNNSIIQLQTSTTLEAGGSVASSFNGIAKLDLPATTRRFQLVLDSDPVNNTTGDVTQGQPVVVKKVAHSKTLAASLRYDKPEEKHWHFSSELGALAQFPLDPFSRARGNYAIPVANWRLNVAETVFWFSSIGLGETTQMDWDRILSAPILFRATSTITCMESPQNCGLRQDLIFFHTLNEHTALVYQASVIGTDTPQFEESAYVLQVRYRYRVHQEWIFLEVDPQLNFPRTDDFNMNASLFLRLEVILGGYNKFM